MVKQLISFTTDGVLSGIIVAMGCSVYLNCENRVLGAVLFSFGLFVIITFRLGLYTGKAGYLSENELRYVIEVLITLVSNFVGVVTGALLLRMTRHGESLKMKSIEHLEVKFGDTLLSMFILAFFCGVMMYIAVEANRRCILEKNHISSIFAVVLPVLIFVFNSFNHSVADLAFFSLSGFYSAGRAAIYFPIVIIGNGLGGVLVPLMKRLSLDK